eukprot:496796-Pelagomonas_calceolata.AAC.5
MHGQAAQGNHLDQQFACALQIQSAAACRRPPLLHPSLLRGPCSTKQATQRNTYSLQLLLSSPPSSLKGYGCGRNMVKGQRRERFPGDASSLMRHWCDLSIGVTGLHEQAAAQRLLLPSPSSGVI